MRLSACTDAANRACALSASILNTWWSEKVLGKTPRLSALSVTTTSVSSEMGDLRRSSSPGAVLGMVRRLITSAGAATDLRFKYRSISLRDVSKLALRSCTSRWKAWYSAIIWAADVVVPNT